MNKYWILIHLNFLLFTIILCSCRSQPKDPVLGITSTQSNEQAPTSELTSEELVSKLGVITNEYSTSNSGTLHLFDLNAQPLPLFTPQSRVLSFQMTQKRVAYLALDSEHSSIPTLFLLNSHGEPLSEFSPIQGVHSFQLTENKLIYVTRTRNPNYPLDLQRGTLHILDLNGKPATGVNPIPHVCLEGPQPVQANSRSWIAYLSCESLDDTHSHSRPQLHILDENHREILIHSPIAQDQTFYFKLTDHTLSYVHHQTRISIRPTHLKTLVFQGRALVQDTTQYRDLLINPIRIHARSNLLAALSPIRLEPLQANLMILTGNGRPVHSPPFQIYLDPTDESVVLAHDRILYLNDFDLESDTATLNMLDSQARPLPSFSPIASVSAVIPAINSSRVAYVSAELRSTPALTTRELRHQIQYHLHLIDLNGVPIPNYQPQSITQPLQLRITE